MQLAFQNISLSALSVPSDSAASSSIHPSIHPMMSPGWTQQCDGAKRYHAHLLRLHGKTGKATLSWMMQARDVIPLVNLNFSDKF
jgi:hypothetical protein